MQSLPSFNVIVEVGCEDGSTRIDTFGPFESYEGARARLLEIEERDDEDIVHVSIKAATTETRENKTIERAESYVAQAVRDTQAEEM